MVNCKKKPAVGQFMFQHTNGCVGYTELCAWYVQSLLWKHYSLGAERELSLHTQLTLTCSNSTIEKLEGVKYVQS